MPASKYALHFALVGLFTFLSSAVTAQPSDQALAESILGLQWKQLSRRAGTIFAGTVISAPAQVVSARTDATLRPGSGQTSTVQLSFRVDEAIAGVETGQILTIHEWAGISTQLQNERPMHNGQHYLIFLYPISRLGLTSPVGGSLGEVALDASGQYITNDAAGDAGKISVLQVARAIRRARKE